MLNRFIWKYFVRRAARANGFLDPFHLFGKLSRFSQPAEVVAPTELLRATAVLHARGLLNAQVIQHNLDWIWPFWVNKQFDPNDPSFIPRSFSLTHINLTHRNWTAVGLPNVDELPLVDPRGLVTPFWDGWSLDFWITEEDGTDLIPCRMDNVQQSFDLENCSVITLTTLDDTTLQTCVTMILENGQPVCQVNVSAHGNPSANLIVSLRPYNPEGVSLIHKVSISDNKSGWNVNDGQRVDINLPPDKFVHSNFHKGDVYHHLYEDNKESISECAVDMCHGAAVFNLGSAGTKDVVVKVPLSIGNDSYKKQVCENISWHDYLAEATEICIPETKFKFLFESSMRTMIMHTAEDVYAGPYVYKRFWFRDAVFITHALLSCGFHDRAERIIDQFESRQKMSGYFESQEGEWDSNGQVLWLIEKYCRITNRLPKREWQSMIHKGARWILKKRLSQDSKKPHSGLMPSGFSAEHFGPNDYYYWDDLWSVSGLKAAAYLCDAYGNPKNADVFREEAEDLNQSIEKSLSQTSQRQKNFAMPPSPYRRLDSASIGSLVAGYPLFLWEADDPRLLDTADYLSENCLVKDGFFHDMSHSGINPYLTLHLAQVYLRNNDKRYLSLMQSIADFASPTGQWPEAMHPQTRGGCMGDGQHTWASVEWLMMIRNCFVYEEESENTIVLCSGLPLSWIEESSDISFGPVWTTSGRLSIRITTADNKIKVSWDSHWHSTEPKIAVRLQGFESVMNCEGQNFVEIVERRSAE